MMTMNLTIGHYGRKGGGLKSHLMGKAMSAMAGLEPNLASMGRYIYGLADKVLG